MVNSRGFSFIEIFVAMGILSVVMLALGGLMVGMSSQVQRSHVKFDQIQLAEQIRAAIRSSDSCKWIMQANGVTIPEVSSTPISLTRLAYFNQSGDVVNEIVPSLNMDLPGTRLEVSSIQLTGPGILNTGPRLAGPTGGATRLHIADLIVTVTHDLRDLAQLRPINISGLELTVNSSSNAIEGCGWVAYGTVGGGRTSCPAGFTLIGTSGSAEAFCISTNREAAAFLTRDGLKAAATTCYNKTPTRARLCSLDEWLMACVSRAPADLTSGNEMVAAIDISRGYSGSEGDEGWFEHVTPQLISAADCGGSWVADVSSLFGYRCCFR